MDSTNREWFIMKNEESVGPYTSEQMIKMKQHKELFDHDYVWSSHLPGWIRVHFLTELKVDTRDAHLLNRRKHPRYPVKRACLLSNQDYVYGGVVKSLSQGGLLIEAEFPHLQIGSEIQVLVKSETEKSEPFMKKAQVANKQFIPHKVQFKSSCLYILTFDHEDPSVVTYLADQERRDNQGGL